MAEYTKDMFRKSPIGRLFRDESDEEKKRRLEAVTGSAVTSENPKEEKPYRISVPIPEDMEVKKQEPSEEPSKPDPIEEKENERIKALESTIRDLKRRDSSPAQVKTDKIGDIKRPDMTAFDSQPDTSPFDQRLKEAMDKYEASKGDIDSREMWETLANAVGKVGAGVYGNKHDVDMSGTQFDKKDWDKKREQSFKENLVDTERVGKERQEALDADRFKKQGKLNLEQLRVDVDYKNKALELDAERLSAAQRDQLAKMGVAQKSKIMTDLVGITKRIQDLAHKAGTEKNPISQDAALQEVKTMVMAKYPGVSEERVDAALKERHWWGGKSDAEISADADELITNLRTLVVEEVLPQWVPYTDSQENVIFIDPEDAKRLEFIRSQK